MFVTLERRDRVAWVTIRRPERLNAMHPATIAELASHLDAIESDNDIWLGVLTGEGERAFSAGFDLKHVAEHPDDPGLADGMHAVVDRTDITKPLIARVNGYAMGGGFELALLCDIIVAADHATFGLPEPRRGLIAAGGGVHRLPRQIPLKVAMGHLLTGRPMDARRALELGIVNEVVPLASLDDAVDRWIADILACAPLSVRATKECVMRGLDMSLHDALRAEFRWDTVRRSSHDQLEGVLAFAEKREPRWTGR